MRPSRLLLTARHLGDYGSPTIMCAVVVSLLHFAEVSADTYYVERPTQILSNESHSRDSQFFVNRHGDKFYGYSSNSITSLLEANNVEDLVYRAGHTVIQGNNSIDDECGAWLKNTYELGNRLIGFYHGESGCDYSSLTTTYNTFVSESFDGGETFQSISPALFPVVVEGNDRINGKGNAGVVQRGNNLYMYYTDTFGAWATGVATANDNDPTNWTDLGKIDGNDYGTSPTKRGNQIALVGIVPCRPWTGIASSSHCTNDGIRLSYSNDGLNFSKISVPLIYSPKNDWVNRNESEIVAYPSIVPLDGSDTWHNGFYLFYSYSFIGNNWSDAEVIRRRVSVQPSIIDSALVRLTSYRKGNDVWSTTGSVTADYEFMNDVPAYLWTSQETSDMRQVYEYYAPGIGKHLLLRSYNPAAGQFLRVIGWIKTTAGSDTVPIYRRFQNGRQSIETNYKSGDILIGYAAKG